MFQECRHVESSGVRCDRPALNGKPFCYFHNRIRRPAREPKPSGGEPEPVKLPFLENSHDVKIALSQVLDGLSTARLDARHAGLCLYAIQIASQHIKPNEAVLISNVVRSVSRSRDGEEMAPVSQVCEAPDDCEDCSQTDNCLKYYFANRGRA